MKWAIYDSKSNMFIHPCEYKHPTHFITFQEYDKKAEPYFFEDTHNLTEFLRRIDENGNLSSKFEEYIYMMCFENRP